MMIKRPVLGQTRRNINKVFRTKELPRNCRLKTTTFGTLLLSKYNYDGNDACRINTGFTANVCDFGEQEKPVLGHLCLHGCGYHFLSKNGI